MKSSSMKSSLLFLALALPTTLLAESPMPTETPTEHVMLDAAQVQWGDAPPFFKPGAKFAVLSGDPGKAGIYTIRLKFPPGYKIALHWHPTDEHVTVIEGDVTLRMGEGDSMHAKTLGPDAYVVLPAKMHHAASSEGGAIVQVHGMGPFEINYIDPKDDPRTK